MSINEWTLAINFWLSCLASATGKPERVQAALMLGSILTVMERDMNGMSVDEMEEYKSIFAAHAQAREMFV